MMLRYILPAIAIMLAFSSTGESARILAIFAFPAKSHFHSFSNLLDELAKRGHQMTVVSAFPKSTPVANYTDIAIEHYLIRQDRPDDEMNFFKLRDISPFLRIPFISNLALDNCEKFLSYPQIRQLIDSAQEFDLIIYEPFYTECAYGFVHRFKVPFVQITSNIMTVWMGDGVGNPAIFSYMPDLLLGYTDHMTFMQRVHNAVFETYTILMRRWFTLPRMETIMKKHFADPTLPSIYEIETNASFLLLNSHVSINYPKPLTPNSAEVGGMHIKEPKKLPLKLQKLLDDAPHGVVYFSLGSVTKSTQMPQEMRDAFVEAFSRLKQKVLWKWEGDAIPGLSANVRTEKWLPQNDILAHPNVKVFITHGGLLSTQEATYHGVPLIAVPLATDQKINSLRAREAGYAQVLDIEGITTGKVSAALSEVLTNARYKENSKRLSTLLRDQPQKPLERAVFWVEYVLRHNGAPHMKSAGLKLNFFQYYLLDIIAIVLLCSLTVLFITVVSCKALCRRIFSGSKKPKHVSKSKKNK